MLVLKSGLRFPMKGNSCQSICFETILFQGVKLRGDLDGGYVKDGERTSGDGENYDS